MNLVKILKGNPKYVAYAAGVWLRMQVHGPQRFGAGAKLTRQLRTSEIKRQGRAA